MHNRILMLFFFSNRFGFVEVFSRLLNWSTLPIAGLLIDPASFGQVVFLSTAINILTTVGTFGQLRTILHYSSAQGYQSFGALMIALMYAAILVPLGYLSLGWFLGSIPLLILLVSLLTILHALLATQRRAFEDAKNFTYLRVSMSTFRFVLVVGTLVIFDNMIIYIAAEVMAIVLSLTLSARYLLEVFTEPKELSATRLRKSGKIGVPILFQTAFFLAIVNYDKLLLGRLERFEELGQYGILVMIASSISFINAFIGMRCEPSIYRAVSLQESLKAAREYQKKLFFAQGLAALFLFLSWQIVGPILDSSNTLQWFVFPVLLIGQMLIQSTVPWSYFLTRATAVSSQITSVIVAAITSVSLNSFLIPVHGATAASFTFFVSSLLYLGVIATSAQMVAHKRTK